MISIYVKHMPFAIKMASTAEGKVGKTTQRNVIPAKPPSVNTITAKSHFRQHISAAPPLPKTYVSYFVLQPLPKSIRPKNVGPPTAENLTL